MPQDVQNSYGHTAASYAASNKFKAELGQSHDFDWVAVKELKLSYQNVDM